MVDKTDQNAADGEETATDGAKSASYGKPPEHTKWKKGQSGNPKGRPKGALNLTTVVANAAKSRVRMTVNGKVKTMSALEAQVEATKLRALQGKGGSEAQMYGLYDQHLPPADQPPPHTLSEEARKILTSHAKLLQLLEASRQPDPADGDGDEPA